MNNFQSGWHLIYTKPRHEKKVHAQLTELKIDSFLPTRKVLRIWHDRKKYIDEPLFPSYVFIYLNNWQSYYGGMDINGALCYVRVGKQIARVQDTVVNNIKLIVNQERDIEVSDFPFRAGEKMVISKGVFAGLVCELVEYNNKQMLLVRIELLQRSVLVTLPTAHLMTV